MEVNSEFVKLPDGYTYRLTNRLHNPKSGYQRYNVTIISPDGKEIPLVGIDERPIMFICEPDKVYALGDVRETLIKEQIGDGTEYYYHLHGYGERTGKYLNACKSNIGLIDMSCDEDLSIDDRWNELSMGAFNSSDIYLIRREDKYVAAFQVRADIDSFFEHRFIFNRKPTAKAVWDAYLISQIELEFSLNRYGENFVCWECGHKVKHWLDLDGNLQEKWDKLKDKYCEC